MRRIDEPVDVDVKGGRPVAFRRQGRRWTIVHIVDRWRYTGRWWTEEGTWRFFKVHTVPEGLFELYYDTKTKTWRLYRAYD